ncbi:hypothetical protein Hdeb2414_s0008g00290321 [Helianthus debilis subsp. tardiflorus]
MRERDDGGEEAAPPLTAVAVAVAVDSDDVLAERRNYSGSDFRFWVPGAGQTVFGSTPSQRWSTVVQSKTRPVSVLFGFGQQKSAANLCSCGF